MSKDFELPPGSINKLVRVDRKRYAVKNVVNRKRCQIQIDIQSNDM